MTDKLPSTNLNNAPIQELKERFKKEVLADHIAACALRGITRDGQPLELTVNEIPLVAPPQTEKGEGK